MISYTKGTWLLIGFAILVMLCLIGLIEVRVPSETLSSELMVGVVLLGYGSIFAWLSLQRKPSKPQNQPHSVHLGFHQGLRLVGRVGEMANDESYVLEKNLEAHLTAQKRFDHPYN